MKNRNFLKNSALLLLPLALAAGVLLGTASPKAKEVEGYSTSSLPTTIDLNDTSASNIRSYYSLLNNLTTSERQGTNLLKNLKDILKSGQKYYSYDTDNNGRKIWQIYEIADRDWAKSPATNLTYGTYNPSTNIITGYQYGTGTSDTKNNPYIHALYVNREVENNMRAWTISGSATSHGGNGEWCIDREHIWPKSHGFETEAQGGARGDPMHLWPGDSEVNSVPHNNYYYGYVNKSSSYTAGKWSYAKDNYYGKSLTSGGSTTVFEPQDCDKGDIARACFYMAARYNYFSGNDSDGIDSNNPNLVLTNSLSDYVSSGYDSNTSKTGKLGILTDLLAWHHADPVDEFEIHRNNLLFTNFTNNRNPFIDFPEWVDYIWGSVTYNGRNYQSYSSTPTGYATPSSDTINGYNSGSIDPVSVTGVSLNKDSTSIEVGNSEVLTASIQPSNATNQSVTWTSSNTSVATVSSSGCVSGVAEGSTTITVRTSDGNYTDSCAVTVVSSGSSGGDTLVDVINCIGFGGYTTGSYSAAGTDQTGKANDTNASNVTYALQVFNGSTGAVRGNQTTANANFSARNTTTYSDYYISNVELNLLEGTAGTLDGSTSDRSLVYFGTSAYSNPTTAPTGSPTSSNENASGVTSLSWSNSDTSKNYFLLYNLKSSGTPSKGEVRITWTPCSGSSEATLSSIEVKTAPTKLSYEVGDDFEPAGLIITATYSDSSTQDIPYEDNEDSFEFDPSENLSTSDTEITISYGGKTTTQAISVTSSGGSSDIESFTQTYTYSDMSNWSVSNQGTASGYILCPDTENDTSVVLIPNIFKNKIISSSVVITINTATYGSGTNPSNETYKVYNSEECTNQVQAILSGTLPTSSTYTNVILTVSEKNAASFDEDLAILITKPGRQIRIKSVQVVFDYVEPAQSTYSQITDASDLRTGDEIVFVGLKSSTYCAAKSLDVDAQTLRGDATTLSGSEINSTTNTEKFTVIRNGNYFNLKTSDNKYLATVGANGYYTKYDTSVTSNSTFTLAKNSNNVLVFAAETNSYKYFRFNQSNTWFSFYGSNSFASDALIYKKTSQVQADSWSTDFMSETNNCSLENWSTLAFSYNNLSNEAKAEIVNVEANASTDYSIRAQAMARYDYMMSDARYSSASHFITGRGTSSAKPVLMLLSEESRKPITLIIICSLVSVSAIGGFFFIKRRKQEKI